MSIPDNVVEVGKGCFSECRSLRSVTFGASSTVERICEWAFRKTSLECLSIPDSVVEVGNWCFYDCKSLQSVTFGVSSQLERFCADAFYKTNIETPSLPFSDCVFALS